MNKKAFKEPQIPSELAEVKDAPGLIQGTREEEGEIFRRQFTGIFCPGSTGVIFLFSRWCFRTANF